MISLAPNLFFGTSIAVNILVLSKHKTDNTTQFIDASGLFKKETNNNILTAKNIEEIVTAFADKPETPHFCQNIDNQKIRENEYNLSVSSYIEVIDNREVVNIAQLNADIETTVAKIDQLRQSINQIIEAIEA